VPRPVSETEPSRVLAFACGVTLPHYVSVYMRVPAGAAALRCRRRSVRRGCGADRRRPHDHGWRALLLAGTAVSAATSFLLPAVETRPALITIYGAAGLGVAAFTPSIMSLVADVAAPGTVGRAYGWYTTALYAGMRMGPLLGGFVAQRWGYRSAFVAAGAVISSPPSSGRPDSAPGLAAGAPERTCWSITGAPSNTSASFASGCPISRRGTDGLPRGRAPAV